ncbi:hypothetical protein EK904_003657, partial [Melospiza melodia maxima]
MLVAQLSGTESDPRRWLRSAAAPQQGLLGGPKSVGTGKVLCSPASSCYSISPSGWQPPTPPRVMHAGILAGRMSRCSLVILPPGEEEDG